MIYSDKLAMVRYTYVFYSVGCHFYNIYNRTENIKSLLLIKPTANAPAFAKGFYFFVIIIYLLAGRLLLINLLPKILLCCRKHQLYPVELVYLRGSGVVINGNDICLGVGVPQLLYDSLSYYMVGETAKGLGAYYIVYALMDELKHFSCKEPSLTCLITYGYKALSHLGKLPDI